jgi:hypothetical protein
MLPLFMLTKRTNVLFDEEMYSQLKYLVKVKGVTVGEYIRGLVRNDTKKITRRVKQREKSILAMVKPCWKYLKDPKRPLNYRKLVEDGRRY